jgi:hypothetical protein
MLYIKVTMKKYQNAQILNNIKHFHICQTLWGYQA